MTKMNIQRRRFLQSMGAAGTAAVLPGAINIAGISQAMAGTTVTDYKALVCINLEGGNDHANTLVPFTYNETKGQFDLELYKEIRGDISLTNNSDGYGYGIDAINAMRLDNTNSGATEYGLHPELKFFHDLFKKGNLAILQNTGVLKMPNTTREMLEDSKTFHKYMPQNLFSHNDQQYVWQTGGIESERKQGWSGHMHENCSESYSSDDISNLLTAISVNAKEPMLSSLDYDQYVVGPAGIPRFLGIAGDEVYKTPFGIQSSQVPKMVEEFMRQESDNVFENYIAQIFSNSFDVHKKAYHYLKNEVDPNSGSVVNEAFKGSKGKLAAKLKIVAHLINIRSKLGLKRQVFNVSMKGFDTHGTLLKKHGKQMKQLNHGVECFYNALANMGVTNNVTTFTFSEFGRTFAGNSSGSDHGWGGHQFILGGAVKGGVYGTTPNYQLNSQDHYDNKGRLIPSTSREQYIATLASWFGVPDDKLEKVVPNETYNFSEKTLGFMTKS